MSIKSAFYNRRDMLKFGITAVGMAAISGRAISSSETKGKEPEVSMGGRDQQLLRAAKKYGGEFGGIEPKAGRS